MSATLDFDTGPLNWVRGDIEAALKSAAERIRAYGTDQSLENALRLARDEVHGATGALRMVGLEGAAKVITSLEDVLSAMDDKTIAADDLNTKAVLDALETLLKWVTRMAEGRGEGELALDAESIHHPAAICVVAHSMGGLVMRDALARHAEGVDRARVPLFVTLASPFGGHPGAAVGVAVSPVVVPAWRSLAPGGDFLAHLHDAALPFETRHTLFFAAGTREGATSDGVVPLASQRDAAALREAALVRGFAETHTGILRSAEARAAVRAELDAHCAP